MFAPLSEDAFGAYVHVTLAAAFAPDPGAQRCMQAPFRVGVGDALQVASAADAFDAMLALRAGDDAVYYEACEGDEVYDRFTLVPTAQPVAACCLLDDP